jgi:hypothetical protein
VPLKRILVTSQNDRQESELQKLGKDLYVIAHYAGALHGENGKEMLGSYSEVVRMATIATDEKSTVVVFIGEIGNLLPYSSIDTGRFLIEATDVHSVIFIMLMGPENDLSADMFLLTKEGLRLKQSDSSTTFDKFFSSVLSFARALKKCPNPK